VVAREVGEQRHVEVHARQAALIQADRRGLDRQRRRALVAQVRQRACQQHRVRRGVAGDVVFHFAARLEHAHAQRADDGRRLAAARQGLAEPHGAGSLAVGAGDGRREHAGIRLFVVGVRDEAGVAFQVLDRQVRHGPLVVPGKAGRIEHHQRRALLDGALNKVTSVGGLAGDGCKSKEHIAQLDAARVRSQVRLGRQLADRIRDSRWVESRSGHMFPCAADSGMMIWVRSESGATFLARSAWAASAENTGPATSPPTCTGPPGSSIMTAMMKRGSDIGAMPMKLPMYL
ncbi:conserved hypothetical protein, partial [Ricinus communis]